MGQLRRPASVFKTGSPFACGGERNRTRPERGTDRHHPRQRRPPQPPPGHHPPSIERPPPPRAPARRPGPLRPGRHHLGPGQHLAAVLGLAPPLARTARGVDGPLLMLAVRALPAPGEIHGLRALRPLVGPAGTGEIHRRRRVFSAHRPAAGSVRGRTGEHRKGRDQAGRPAAHRPDGRPAGAARPAPRPARLPRHRRPGGARGDRRRRGDGARPPVGDPHAPPAGARPDHRSGRHPAPQAARHARRRPTHGARLARARPRPGGRRPLRPALSLPLAPRRGRAAFLRLGYSR